MLCIAIPEVITDVMSSKLTDFALNIYLSVQTNKQMTNGMMVARLYMKIQLRLQLASNAGFFYVVGCLVV